MTKDERLDVLCEKATKILAKMQEAGATEVARISLAEKLTKKEVKSLVGFVNDLLDEGKMEI